MNNTPIIFAISFNCAGKDSKLSINQNLNEIIMGENGVLVFPDAAAGRAASSIDPNLLLAMQNNGGLGNGNGGWFWIILLWVQLKV